MTPGEFLFRLLRTHEIEREPKENLWLRLPERRRQEYEAAADALLATRPDKKGDPVP